MNYHKKLKNIKGFLIDIEGVLAENRIMIDENGNLIRSFYYRDLWTIRYAISKGIKIAVLSYEITPSLEKICKNIGFTNIYQGNNNRLAILNDFCIKNDLTYEEVGYIGDDIDDIDPIQAVGFSACPADAVSEVVDLVDYIASQSAGQGCVREIIEKTLKVQGKWAINFYY